ncbi:hypothetical protein AB0A05_27250 [Streptomyces sp. NPDC046374]|uniref:hypothetical protein n=1 Tax=Streptomyces sp. NPDC046374 TaxID=3154917 RepID=UPI0033EDAFDA
MESKTVDVTWIRAALADKETRTRLLKELGRQELVDLWLAAEHEAKVKHRAELAAWAAKNGPEGTTHVVFRAVEDGEGVRWSLNGIRFGGQAAELGVLAEADGGNELRPVLAGLDQVEEPGYENEILVVWLFEKDA